MGGLSKLAVGAGVLHAAVLCQGAAIEARDQNHGPGWGWGWWPTAVPTKWSSRASSTVATSHSSTSASMTRSATASTTGITSGTSGSVSSLSTGIAPTSVSTSVVISLSSPVSTSAGTLPTPPATAIYRDPRQPVEARVQDLLSYMTIEEKASQMMQGDMTNWLNITDGSFNETGLIFNMENRAGQFYVGQPISWELLADTIAIGQAYLVNNTRLGIPAFVQTEGIHGFLIPNATIFNSPIGYACSFNMDLVNQMAVAIGQESAALGVNMLFAPLGDLARELRYGRLEESFSEDPFLAGETAYNYVRGLQSKNVSATVKHFAAVSNPEQGLNTGPVHGGERELMTTWLPSYKRAIIDGNAFSIMSAYSSYDGVPLASNHHILTEILRNQWGYKYWVTGDAGSLDRLISPFGVCAKGDMDCVTLNALPAGNDVEMGGGTFNYRAIPRLVASGQLPLSVVDTAVSRQLRAKFELGIFEHPNTALAASEWSSAINTPATVELARTLDRESIVLLQNPSNVLPLKKTSKVAVIGPMASGWMNYGDYVPHPAQMFGVTPLDGMQAAAADPSLITYALGAERWSFDESGFAEAVATAQAADVVVAVVGTWSRDQNELWQGLNATTGEHVDVDDLSLVGVQRALLQALVQTGKPVVIVLQSGKPVTEDWISKTGASLVQQFYPSEQGGNALADILYGDHSPSGRLSVSFPHSVGDLPIYYDYLNSGHSGEYDPGYYNADGSLHFGHSYVTGTSKAWYPFGYGLSYTNFTWGNVTLSATNATATDTITASVPITNSGSVDSQEVVQLYIVDVLGSVDRPNKRLKGFKKVMIKAGETMNVAISVNVADLGLYNPALQYVVEPGQFTVYMSQHSADTSKFASFYVS